MSPLAPAAMESTVLPSIRIYTKEPSKPAAKLYTRNNHKENQVSEIEH